MNKMSVLDLLGVDADYSIAAQPQIKVRKRNERTPFAEIVTENEKNHYRFGQFDSNGFVIVSD